MRRNCWSGVAVAEPLAVTTVIAANYVAQGRVMVRSLRRFHPDVPLYIVLAGPRDSVGALEQLGAKVVLLSEMRFPGLRGMLLRYDCKQLCAALKPSLLGWLFDLGHGCAVFVDPDVLVLDTLEPCFRVVLEHALTLTPHIGPEFAERPDEHLEHTLLMAGMFNGGFIGATDCDETRRFLGWWRRRLRTHCVEEVREGMHFDQRWLDLAAAFVADLHILRDPGCNAAYWRLPWLELEERAGTFFVQGQPLRLFHFSGYDAGRPEFVSRFRPGWRVDELGPAAALFRLYQRLLLEEGWMDCLDRGCGLPQTYKIVRLARQVRRLLGGALRASRRLGDLLRLWKVWCGRA